MKADFATFKEYLDHTYEGPVSATDIVIRHHDGTKEGVVVIQRKNTPYGIAWPGGIAEGIALPENAIKEAREETGLRVVLDSLDVPLRVSPTTTEDPRGVYISSIAYTGVGYGTLKPHPEEDALSAHLVTVSQLEKMLQLPVYDPQIHTNAPSLSPGQRRFWAFQSHKEIAKKYLEKIDYGR